MEEIIMSKLAINGGSKAVTIAAEEQWTPPCDEIRNVIDEKINAGKLSGDWEDTYFKFEDEFAAYTGAKNCLAFNEGTFSLWAAYLGIGLKPGDEVIVPSYTWIASISPALYIGARPVFCEVEKGKLVADPADIRKRITPKTKAIVVVHIHGNVANMDEIMEIARENNLYVVEDCSHCHGAEWNGKKAGTIGHIGCFSMQGDFITGKALPAGEGGMIITNDDDLYNKIVFYTQINRPLKAGEQLDEKYKRFYPANLGVKFRAHPFALCIARVMLKYLDYRNDQKRSYRQKMNEALSGIPGIITISEYEKARAGGFYGGMQMLYDATAYDNLPKERFLEAIKAEGVDMSYRDYDALHMTPLFQEGYDIYGNGQGAICGDYIGYKNGDLPVTESTWANLMGMPVFTNEPAGYAEQVIEAFRKVSENYKELL